MRPLALEDYDIYLKREGTPSSIADCPSQLRDLFVLILSVRSLEWDYFGGTTARERSLQPTPVMQYQSELKLEAEELAGVCANPRRPDDSEERWVQVMQPIVLYRFDAEFEEVYARRRHHHCFICGRHFPLRSRPLLAVKSKRLFGERVHGVHGAVQETADANVCNTHLNLSIFDIDKVSYREHGGEKRKIPDLTVGLLVSSKSSWHAPPDMTPARLTEILEDKLVEPFFHTVLDPLEDDGSLKPLFLYPKAKKGHHTSRVHKPSMNFPFMIWEAKRAWLGDPVSQNALKVRMILQWQQDMAKRANITWVPLVFHLVSVGSEWKIYACHIQSSLAKADGVYWYRMLWTGDCIDPEKALQFLYLIDVIALWGQFQYRPFIGACIRILELKGRWSHFMDNGQLIREKKAINTRNFRSLQFEGLLPSGPTIDPMRFQRAGTFTSVSEMNDQFKRRMRLLDLKNYFIPERDAYIWVSHRELRGIDLLVVRVDDKGVVLPPLVIFESSDWGSEQFVRIIQEEKARMPQNVEVEFRYDKDHTSVLQKCFDVNKGYCTGSELQFCAILPLRPKTRTTGDASTQEEFATLEHLLGLWEVVKTAESMNAKWCTCQGAATEDMVLCDSTKCVYGWYHMECVGLKEVNSAQQWVCRACLRTDNNVVLSKYDNDGAFDNDILEASDVRIQCVRSLSRAWAIHKWPKASEVQAHMYKKICCEIEMETQQRKFRDTIESLEAKGYSSTRRCWAVIRDDPLRMTHMKQRFRTTVSQA